MIHKEAQRGTKDHTVPQSYTKTMSNHSIPNTIQ
jgi:hypothetical protein